MEQKAAAANEEKRTLMEQIEQVRSHATAACNCAVL